MHGCGMTNSAVRVKRAYQDATSSDGKRILVDGMWPRGVSKDKLAVDTWLKAIAPSAGLRKWFDHDAGKWTEFKRRYAQELAHGEQAAALSELREYCKQGRVTLVYAARDEQHNNAVALQALL